MDFLLSRFTIQDLASFGVTWTKSNDCPRVRFFIALMLGWLSYLLIMDNSISSESKFSGIGSFNPIPSAISLKYLLNILATDSDSVTIKSFSPNSISILALCFGLMNGLMVAQKCWFFGPPSHRSVKFWGTENPWESFFRIREAVS